MPYILHLVLSLIDSLGDFGTAVVLLTVSLRRVRAMKRHARVGRHHAPPTAE
jgi:hypothetical protein